MSRKGGQNDRWKERGREETDTAMEEDELPGQDAENSAIINALRRRRICFFHARDPAARMRGTTPSKEGVAFLMARPWCPTATTPAGTSLGKDRPRR